MRMRLGTLWNTLLSTSFLPKILSRRILYMPMLGPKPAFSPSVSQEVFLINSHHSLAVARPTFENLENMYVTVGHSQSIFFHEGNVSLTFAYAVPGSIEVGLAPFFYKTHIEHFTQEYVADANSPKEIVETMFHPVTRAKMRHTIRLHPDLDPEFENEHSKPGEHKNAILEEHKHVDGKKMAELHVIKEERMPGERVAVEERIEEEIPIVHRRKRIRHQIIESDSEMVGNTQLDLKIIISDPEKETFRLIDENELCLSYLKESFVMTRCIPESGSQVFKLMMAADITKLLEEEEKKLKDSSQAFQGSQSIEQILKEKGDKRGDAKTKIKSSELEIKTTTLSGGEQSKKILGAVVKDEHVPGKNDYIYESLENSHINAVDNHRNQFKGKVEETSMSREYPHERLDDYLLSDGDIGRHERGTYFNANAGGLAYILKDARDREGRFYKGIKVKDAMKPFPTNRHHGSEIDFLDDRHSAEHYSDDESSFTGVIPLFNRNYKKRMTPFAPSYRVARGLNPYKGPQGVLSRKRKMTKPKGSRARRKRSIFNKVPRTVNKKKAAVATGTKSAGISKAKKPGSSTEVKKGENPKSFISTAELQFQHDLDKLIASSKKKGPETFPKDSKPQNFFPMSGHTQGSHGQGHEKSAGVKANKMISGLI